MAHSMYNLGSRINSTSEFRQAKWIAFVMLAFVLVLGVSCGGANKTSEATAAATAFLKAASSNNVEEALKHVLPENRDKMKAAGFANISLPGRPKFVVKATGEGASVRISNAKKGDVSEVNLVQKDGKWWVESCR